MQASNPASVTLPYVPNRRASPRAVPPPVPPRRKTSRPPPLPAHRKQTLAPVRPPVSTKPSFVPFDWNAPPAWDDAEESEPTDVCDIASMVATNPEGVRPILPALDAAVAEVDPVPELLDARAKFRARIGQAAGTIVYFVGYLADDAFDSLTRIAPGTRAVLARVRAQWKRASERANKE